MAVSHLDYQLNNGYIDHWLVAGPQAIAVADLERFSGEDLKLQIARHYAEHEPASIGAPVERDTFTLGGDDAGLALRRCLDDHFVDLTAFYHTCHYLRAWAYAEVEYTGARAATMRPDLQRPGGCLAQRRAYSSPRTLPPPDPAQLSRSRRP